MEENQVLTQKLCSFCKKEMQPADAIFCNHCGHPENGTDKQRAQFFGKRAMEKNKNIDAADKIKSARNTLFVISGAMAIFGFIGYSVHQQVSGLAVDLILAIIYLSLAFWSEKKPMMALLLALLLYITTISILAVMNPSTLFQGVIWKILIITYLGKGMYSASQVKSTNQ